MNRQEFFDALDELIGLDDAEFNAATDEILSGSDERSKAWFDEWLADREARAGASKPKGMGGAPAGGMGDLKKAEAEGAGWSGPSVGRAPANLPRPSAVVMRENIENWAKENPGLQRMYTATGAPGTMRQFGADAPSPNPEEFGKMSELERTAKIAETLRNYQAVARAQKTGQEQGSFASEAAGQLANPYNYASMAAGGPAGAGLSTALSEAQKRMLIDVPGAEPIPAKPGLRVPTKENPLTAVDTALGDFASGAGTAVGLGVVARGLQKVPGLAAGAAQRGARWLAEAENAIWPPLDAQSGVSMAKPPVAGNMPTKNLDVLRTLENLTKPNILSKRANILEPETAMATKATSELAGTHPLPEGVPTPGDLAKTWDAAKGDLSKRIDTGTVIREMRSTLKELLSSGFDQSNPEVAFLAEQVKNLENNMWAYDQKGGLGYADFDNMLKNWNARQRVFQQRQGAGNIGSAAQEGELEKMLREKIESLRDWTLVLEDPSKSYAAVTGREGASVGKEALNRLGIEQFEGGAAQMPLRGGLGLKGGVIQSILAAGRERLQFGKAGTGRALFHAARKLLTAQGPYGSSIGGVGASSTMARTPYSQLERGQFEQLLSAIENDPHPNAMLMMASDMNPAFARLLNEAQQELEKEQEEMRSRQ